MSVHHMMAICFYCDFSHLCRDYRSTFRKLETDTNEDSVRERHKKYYFFSRFLYEAIEFYGDVFVGEQTVYHGLDKPFLFKEFLTHFNAPTSTTPDLLCAVNFSKENGIILALRNGNEIINQNATISQFLKDQPRYLDVSWISDFSNEKEYLFYGDNIIFKIHDIHHNDKQEVPKHTLKQLNLLQRLIENKQIDWENEPQSRVSKLCKKLQKTRKMNIILLTPNDEEDAKNENETKMLEQQLFKSMSSQQFIAFAMKILTDEEITKKKYKWRISSDDKTKTINAFKEYCDINQMDGQIFEEVARKLVLIWMQSHHGIIFGKSAKLYTILNKEIAEYDGKIMSQIEEIEKKKTEKFNVKYYLKLFHYFTVSRFDFIAIRSLFNIPQILQSALFEDNKSRNIICFTQLTDIFNKVNHIAFTELTYNEMVRNCSNFCKSIIKYSQNINNNNKRLKSVIFKSVNLTNSKHSIMLKKCVQKYQLKTSHVSIRYKFKYKVNHILSFNIHSFGVDEQVAISPITGNDDLIDREMTTFMIDDDYVLSDDEIIDRNMTSITELEEKALEIEVHSIQNVQNKNEDTKIEEEQEFEDEEIDDKLMKELVQFPEQFVANVFNLSASTSARL